MPNTCKDSVTLHMLLWSSRPVNDGPSRCSVYDLNGSQVSILFPVANSNHLTIRRSYCKMIASYNNNNIFFFKFPWLPLAPLSSEDRIPE